MKAKYEIEKALHEMEIRRKSYLLDMCAPQYPNSVVYNTDIIRKIEVTDATIHALKWVLESPPEQPAKQSAKHNAKNKKPNSK